MECKYISILIEALVSFGINRYIMECKWLLAFALGAGAAELIDTLWNVNTISWNSAGSSGFWINRYIMECKWSRIKYWWISTATN